MSQCYRRGWNTWSNVTLKSHAVFELDLLMTDGYFFYLIMVTDDTYILLLQIECILQLK